MNKLKYQKVIDLIDEDIIKEAEIKTSELSDTENGNAADASGVERYRGIVWRRITAAASAVLLIAGIGAGGALMLKKHPPLLDEVNNVAVTETTDDMGIKARGSGETAEVTSDGKAASAETDTKESKIPPLRRKIKKVQSVTIAIRKTARKLPVRRITSPMAGKRSQQRQRPHSSPFSGLLSQRRRLRQDLQQ